MPTDRMVRVNELIRREIADGVFRVINERDFDLSALTVVRVITNPDLRTAKVLVSLRGEKPEQERMLRVLRKNRGELQRRIGANIVLKYTPRLTFELDVSVEKGDRVLTVLTKMEIENGPESGPDPAYEWPPDAAPHASGEDET